MKLAMFVFRCAVLGAALFGLSCQQEPVHEQTAELTTNADLETVTPLTYGLVDERSLAPEERVVYSADLKFDEVLQLRIEQNGLDVKIVLPGAQGSIDRAPGRQVEEDVWWIAQESQELHFEVHALAGQGSYRLIVEKMGAASEIDRRRFEAFQLARQGGSLDDSLVVERFRAALDIWSDVGPLRQEILTWRRLENLPDTNDALAALDQAVEKSQSLGLTWQGWMHFYRGRKLARVFRYASALEDLKRSHEIFTATEDLIGKATSAYNLATVLKEQDNLKEACDSYQYAQSIYKTLNSYFYYKSGANLAGCWMDLVAMEEALALLEDLLATLPVDNSLGPEKHDRLLSEILMHLGWWYRLEDQPQQGLILLQQALQYANAGQQIYLMDRIGTVYLDLGHLQASREAYEEVLQADLNEEDRAETQANFCRLEQKAGNFEAAIEKCQEAINIFKKKEAVGATAFAYRTIAKLYQQENRLEEAENFISRALEHIESQRALLGDVMSQQGFLSGRQEIYQLAVELRMKLHEREPNQGWEIRALEVSELTRARALIDLLEVEGAYPSSIASLALLDAEKRLLSALRDHGEGEESATVRNLEEQLAAVRKTVRNQAPSYASLTKPWLPDIQEIQKLLEPDTLLLVFHLGNDQVYLWKLSDVEVSGMSLGERSRLERFANAWYQTLASSNDSLAGGTVERHQARRLGEALLKTVAEELPQYQRVVIVGDGILQRIPFGALPSPVEDEGVRPLIAEYEVTTLPSASILPILRRRVDQSRSNGLLAIVADAVYAAGDERLVKSESNPSRASLFQRLPGSAEEAKNLLSLASSAPTRLLEGFSARRDRVLAGALDGFRIVHFATHAQTRPGSGHKLGLVLSLFDENGMSLDGILSLDDLYNLSLTADLAVLSACSTLLGEDVAGEGLVGLTRGFMHAGTPRIVVSLWDVQDNAARETMSRFYKFLLHDELPPGEALRQAQVSMWRDGWAVRDWGAFILQGDWQPFPLSLP